MSVVRVLSPVVAALGLVVFARVIEPAAPTFLQPVSEPVDVIPEDLRCKAVEASVEASLENGGITHAWGVLEQLGDPCGLPAFREVMRNTRPDQREAAGRFVDALKSKFPDGVARVCTPSGPVAPKPDRCESLERNVAEIMRREGGDPDQRPWGIAWSTGSWRSFDCGPIHIEEAFESGPGMLQVAEICPGFEAERQGMRRGDVILSVNGVSTGGKQLREFWFNREVDMLIMREGRTRQLRMTREDAAPREPGPLTDAEEELRCKAVQVWYERLLAGHGIAHATELVEQLDDACALPAFRPVVKEEATVAFLRKLLEKFPAGIEQVCTVHPAPAAPAHRTEAEICTGFDEKVAEVMRSADPRLKPWGIAWRYMASSSYECGRIHMNGGHKKLLQVDVLCPGYPAEKHGLRLDDVIVTVNRVPASDDSAQMKEFWTKRTVDLELMRDGKPVSLRMTR